MLLEFLSFMPMFHEKVQGGKVTMKKSNTVTKSFCSKDTFWEGIDRTRNYLIDHGEDGVVIPFRNDKGKLKDMVINKNDIEFNKALEKANPNNLKEWVFKYFLNESKKNKYPKTWAMYIVYNHDGEFVHGFTYKIEFDIDKMKNMLLMRESNNRKEFYCLEAYEKWTPVMSEDDYYELVGYDYRI